MKNVHCDYCGFDFEFADDATLPDSCPNCFSPLPEEQAATAGGRVELVYQTNGARVVITFDNDVVLGRQAAGSNLLKNIKQISRSHCKIEYSDKQYFVTDLGSTNGTFLGAAKIDCKAHPRQLLHDGEILYLGREPFLVQLCQETAGADVGQVSFKVAAASVGGPLSESEEEKPAQLQQRGYECRNCREYISPVPEFTCPKCNTYNG